MGSTEALHRSASATTPEPSTSNASVRIVVAEMVSERFMVQPRDRRLLKYVPQPNASRNAAAPSSAGRISARIASPLKTAPVAPSAASAIGKAQHEDAKSAPNPTTAPVPAKNLAEGIEAGSDEADFPTSVVVIVVFPCDPCQADTRSNYGFKRKMLTKPRGITAGQLAKAAGVNLETIRYYENVGLMPPPPRTQGGHRTYDETHTKRLAFIRRARELGFVIDDVRALLALAGPEHTSCAEVKEIAVAHLTQVRSKIVDLSRLERILANTVSRCTSDPTAHCPVLDMLEP